MKTTLIVNRINKITPLLERKVEECGKFPLEDINWIDAIGLSSFAIYCIDGNIHTYDNTYYYEYSLTFE